MVQKSTPDLVQLLPKHEPGSPVKVNELDVAPGVHHDVLRLQAYVQNALLMTLVHSTHNRLE